MIAVAAAAIAVVVIVILGVANPFQARSGQPAPQPAMAFHHRAGPSIPAKGAYFGAWVMPSVYSQPARIETVQALQRQIGRRLDIVHVYVRPQAAFPTTSERAFLRQGSTLLVSWALNDTRGIAAGRYDGLIGQMAREVKALGKPVFLEWRWEMDRPNLRAEVGSPADYVAAWKHIRAVFVRQHADNVAWTWCPTSRGFASGDAAAFYPGDSEVDWVCTDAYPGPGPYRPFADVVRPFLAWASHHPKPIMIGEYGVPASYPPQQRARWLRGAAQTARADPQIKAMVYFDASPPGQLPNRSYALDSPAAVQAFRSIAGDRYFNPRGVPVAQP
jgi:hypothetical protein